MNSNAALDVLIAGRRIADHARAEGVSSSDWAPRMCCEHMGAVLADSILQSGLNYRTVVRPRVIAILDRYPDATTISGVRRDINKDGTATFLNWRHSEKVLRFESLINFFETLRIEEIEDLRTNLMDSEFCRALQSINGVGPKTVDYMGCLVGLDFIAVDRHVRAFAMSAGVENRDYHFLRRAFCCAADFLLLGRREFDAWLWRRAASKARAQLDLVLEQ